MWTDRPWASLGSFVISFFLSLFSSRNWRLFPVILFILGPSSLFVDTMTWIPLRSVLPCSSDLCPSPWHMQTRFIMRSLLHYLRGRRKSFFFFASTPIVTLSGKQPTIYIIVNSMVFVLSRLESWGHMFIPTWSFTPYLFFFILTLFLFTSTGLQLTFFALYTLASRHLLSTPLTTRQQSQRTRQQARNCRVVV